MLRHAHSNKNYIMKIIKMKSKTTIVTLISCISNLNITLSYWHSFINNNAWGTATSISASPSIPIVLHWSHFTDQPNLAAESGVASNKSVLASNKSPNYLLQVQSYDWTSSSMWTFSLGLQMLNQYAIATSLD